MKKIIFSSSTKGGGGKSTISRECVISFEEGKVVIIETDSFNDSSSLVANSEKVRIVSYKAYGDDLDKAIDEAIIADAMGEETISIDMGAGHDTIISRDKMAQEFGDRFEIWIPIMPDPETMLNAIQTIENVPKNTKKVLVFQNFSDLKRDFWFIFGNENFGIEANLDFLKNFDETIEFKRTELVGITKMYQTTMSDLAEFHRFYDYESERKIWATTLDRSEFSKRMGQHRLSVACDIFISEMRESRKKTSSWK